MAFAKLAEAFAPDSIRVLAAALDREHAVELAGHLLVSSGRSTPDYTIQMIEVFDTHGPYFVIAPGIAIAHAKPSTAVLSTGLSLLTLAEPVVFGNVANDPVRLVIGMCAVDHDSHIEMLADLAALLGNTESVNFMLNALDSEQIRSQF